MSRYSKNSETAGTLVDASGVTDEYCGTSYAAKLLGLSVATVQSMVEKGELEAWKTQGGHRRISLRSINKYIQRYSPQPDAGDSAWPARLQVLVIESDERIREFYRMYLDQWQLPMDCTLVPSAFDALMLMAGLRPDLLITDLDMAEVDGFRMLRALQANPQLADLRILVVTGMDAEALEARGGLPPETMLRSSPVNFDWLHGYLSALIAARQKQA